MTFNVGPEGFTEDWGAFELDSRKFNGAFKSNFIDLGMFCFLSLQVIESNGYTQVRGSHSTISP